MIIAESILKYLDENSERLKLEYQLTKIGLFGSVARGDQNPDSDIDILVEFEPGTADLYDLKHKLKKEIQEIFHRPVDICRLKYIKPVFLKQIQSEAKYV